MQTKKLNLANIKGKLSRSEMKNIMAGSGEGDACNCNSSDDCAGNQTKKTCYNGAAYSCTPGTKIGWCEV